MRPDATRRSSSSGDRELPRMLEQGLGGDLDYYSEFIDQARFPDAEYQTAFRDFLRVKYRGQRFDLVIAMQDVRLEFVDERSGRVVSATRRSCSSRSLPRRRRLANSTGVIAELNLARHARAGRRRCSPTSGTSSSSAARRARPGVRAHGAGAVPAVRVPTRRSSICPACRPASSRRGWRPCPTIPSSTTWSSIGTARARTSIRWSTWIESRPSPMRRSIAGSTRRWTTASSEAACKDQAGPDGGGRPAGPAGASRRARRQHPDVVARSERQSGRLAPAAALGHQRSRACLPARSSGSGSRRSGTATGSTSSLRSLLLLAQTALIAGLLVQRTRRRQAEEQLRGKPGGAARAATSASAISARGCCTRRKPSARGSRASCTTTSASRWRCSRSISSC